MTDEGISPFLEQIESEVVIEASGNPNNALAFDSQSQENSVVQTVEIAAEDYNKYLIKQKETDTLMIVIGTDCEDFSKKVFKN